MNPGTAEPEDDKHTGLSQSAACFLETLNPPDALKYQICVPKDRVPISPPIVRSEHKNLNQILPRQECPISSLPVSFLSASL